MTWAFVRITPLRNPELIGIPRVDVYASDGSGGACSPILDAPRQHDRLADQRCRAARRVVKTDFRGLGGEIKKGLVERGTTDGARPQLPTAILHTYWRR